MESLLRQLDDSGIEYISDESLAAHTTFKIGGPARLMILPRSVEQIRRVVQLSRTHRLPLFVLGSGSNV